VGPATRALVVTHYAGHPQDFGGFPVPVVEDAAHALGSRIDGRACGTLGVFGCLSFHATKNVVAGEGGALLASRPDALGPARIFREKGTNREDFAAGRVDHYAWVGLGSSFVMPELSAAVARAQLAKLDRIQEARRRVAQQYDDALAGLERAGRLRVVRQADGGVTSHHIYAVLVDPDARQTVIARMREAGVQTASHFVPLHASPYGREVGGRVSLPRTDRLAASVLRLPIYPGLSDADVHHIAASLERALTS
jgi:dTDP-4-amino-4,6-dideoxygalactose transaminase